MGIDNRGVWRLAYSGSIQSGTEDCGGKMESVDEELASRAFTPTMEGPLANSYPSCLLTLASLLIRLFGASAYAPCVGAQELDEHAWLSRMNARVDQMIASWSQLPQKRVTLAGNIIFAHGRAIKHVPLDALLKYADALKEAGALRVDINPAVTSLSDPEIGSKYDALVEHIRRLGLKLAINPEFWNDLPIHSFQDFEVPAIKACAQLAARYRPDNFVLIHEPTTMQSRMGIQTTPQDWRHYIQAAARAVKEASPQTLLGAGAFFSELNFFEDFATIPELDFLTLDIYFAAPRAIEAYDRMAGIAHAAHKGLYIEETGRPHFVSRSKLGPASRGVPLEDLSEKGTGSADFEPLDIKWMKAMKLYAATHGMETVTLFRTTVFFRYVSSGSTSGMSAEYNRQALESIESGQRTNMFRAFQALSRE